MSPVGGAWSLLAESSARTYFEFSRFQYMEQWWHLPLFFLVAVLIVVFVIGLYRRDSVELPRAMRWLLTILRLTTFAGLFLFFLGLEKRTEQRVFKSSRAIVAVDSSQSMELVDRDPTSNPDGVSRAALVAQALSQDGLLDELRKKHDVVVYRFDEADQPAQIASLPRTSLPPDMTENEGTKHSKSSALSEARNMLTICMVLLGVSALALLLHFFGGRILRSRENESWALLTAVTVFLIAAIIFGVNNIRNPNIRLAHVTGAKAIDSDANDDATDSDEEDEDEEPIDWQEALRPTGVSTKLGEAVQYLSERERGGPIAGICLLTDGNSNAGTDWREAMQVARDAEIPVFPIGLGTDRPPVNARVVDVEAPARVYPGDAFNLTAFVQAFGLGGQSVRVQLIATQPPASSGEAETSEQLLDEVRVRLGADGEVQPVEFEVLPQETGRVRYIARLKSPTEDLDARDDQQATDVRIIDRKSRVLLLAGGPTREYRFLRVMCFRDREITVDVHIQGGSPEMAQEADAILEEFPTTAEEMFEYDCVVAFDPDWMSLSEEQIKLLERWVAEKAGGLILVAGPVYTPEWTSLSRSRAADEIVKALYPVTFYRGSAALFSRKRYASTQPWPLEFTDEGAAARFLWPEDNLSDATSAWESFNGVYGFQTVRGAKPASVVYARFSNPDTKIDSELPVYFAGQFYGAGRVFYLGSGEMWRLNEVSIRYFENFYTKLIRYISEGRLLRDSSRGVLLVSKDRCILGETVVVRSSLSDAQFRPLIAESVEASLIGPDGIRRPLTLRRLQETGQEGTFTGQFAATSEGDFRVELEIPDSPKFELLDKTVRVRMPDREVESPQRNDSLLNELATTTGGEYFVGTQQALSSTNAATNNVGGSNEPRLLAAMTPQDQETYFPGAPDKAFQQRLMAWLLALIAGTLGLEWLIRRLSRLA